MDFCNICLQSDEIPYYSYEEGHWHEGFGRERLRWDDEVPDWLRDYIDYDAYGEDHDEFVYVGEDGYIDYDNDYIDKSLYDAYEIMGEANWDWEYDPAEHGAPVARVEMSTTAMFNFL